MFPFLQKPLISRRMPSSKMWLRVTVVRTDVSEERIISIIRVKRIIFRTVLHLLVTANFHSSLNFFAIMIKAMFASETSVIIRFTRRHNRGNIKSLVALFVSCTLNKKWLTYVPFSDWAGKPRSGNVYYIRGMIFAIFNTYLWRATCENV
jgi:hypothetical protein